MDVSSLSVNITFIYIFMSLIPGDASRRTSRATLASKTILTKQALQTCHSSDGWQIASNVGIYKERVMIHGIDVPSCRPLLARTSVACQAVASNTCVVAGSRSLEEGKKPLSGWQLFNVVATTASNFFPLFVVAFAVLGVAKPSSMTWVPSSLLTMAIGLSMLGMGLTLTFKDFTRVLSNPKQIFTGVVLQYTVMPSLAFLISRAVGLPLDLTIGLCIVGACPGGTASNIVTYLAKADVPLSVTMTTASTMGAVVMTPFLTNLLLGTLVPVDALGLLFSTLQVVLLPVIIGCALNQAFPRFVAKISPLSALTAVFLVAFICGRVMAENSTAVLSAGFPLLFSVFALHSGGFLLGYMASKLLGGPESVARTNSIEVGMQNSALGALLATQHFPANPLAAVPCAISACMHSTLGSLLAAFWSSRIPDDITEKEEERRANSIWRRKAEVRSWIYRWRARTGVSVVTGKSWVTQEEREMYSQEQLEFLARKRETAASVL